MRRSSPPHRAPHLARLTAVCVSLFCGWALAQEEAPEIADNAAESLAPAPSGSAQAPSQAEFDQLKERVAQLEAREAQHELDGLTEQPIVTQPKLDIYGFFDFSLYKRFIDSNNVLNGVQDESLTFALSHVNLYLASQLSPALSAMVELGFSFLPMGRESYSLSSSGLSFEREESIASDPMTTEVHRLGGVTIERAELTYRPRDAFSITAGRFLTPFGIWNVDHGSPVLLTAVPPFFMVRDTMPLAQTGIYLHGSILPRAGFFFDYGLTLSNGRGPTEAILDLDDNKSLGLVLKISHDGDEVSWSVRGYGYLGKTTDTTKTLTMPSTPEGLPGFSNVTIERYTELAGALAILLETHGLRLQLEYVYGMLRYDRRPQREIPILEYELVGTLQPDFTRFDAYLLAGYTLPLHSVVRVTPYLMGEHSTPDDTQDDYTVYLLRAGLNVSPQESLYLKLEAMRVAPFDSIYLTPVWGIAAQMAVAF